MKLVRAAMGAFLALMVIVVAWQTPATGQDDQESPGPYQSPFGDLLIEADDLMVGSTVTVSGIGFGPAADIVMTVRRSSSSEPAIQTEDKADGDGAFRANIELVDPIGPGQYTATVKGPAIDGLILDLSGAFTVQAPPEPTATPAPQAQPTTPPAAAPAPTPRPPIVGPTSTTQGSTESAAGDDSSQQPQDASSSDGSGTTVNQEGTDAGTIDAEGADNDEEAVAAAPGDSGGDDGSNSMRTLGLIAAGVLIAGGIFGVWRSQARQAPRH